MSVTIDGKTVSFTDQSGKEQSFNPDEISMIGLWDSGQMNIFFASGRPTSITDVNLDDANAIFSALPQIPDQKNKFLRLSLRDDFNNNSGYTFLYNADHIASFAVKKRGQEYERYTGAEELFYVDGLGFNPSAEERETFLSTIKERPEKWLTLSPEAEAPFNTREGTFIFREDRIKSISGYLLGNAIFDMDDWNRIFVPIAENPKRTQHIEMAKAIDALKPIQNILGDAAYINPDHFDPDEVRFSIIDFGVKGKKNALLIYEDWHLPFHTVEDAIKAVEDYVRTYKNQPDYTYTRPTVPTENPEFNGPDDLSFG